MNSSRSTIGCQIDWSETATIGIRPAHLTLAVQNGWLPKPAHDLLALIRTTIIEMDFEDSRSVACAPSVAPRRALRVVLENRKPRRAEDKDRGIAQLRDRLPVELPNDFWVRLQAGCDTR